MHGKPELHSFALFDADRIKQALSNPAKKLSFLVGPAFFFGSLLFVIGAAAQLDVTYWQDKWPKWQQLAFVDGPFLVWILPAIASSCWACTVDFPHKLRHPLCRPVMIMLLARLNSGGLQAPWPQTTACIPPPTATPTKQP